MDVNFGPINLQILMKLRALAAEDPTLVGGLLGIPTDLVEVFATLSPEDLAAVACVAAPLFQLRGDVQWWRGLLAALGRGDRDQVAAIVECVSLRDGRGG